MIPPIPQLGSKAFFRSAHSIYTELRSQEPLHRTAVGSYLVSRHEDVKTLLNHPATRNANLADAMSLRSGLIPGKDGHFQTLSTVLKDFLLLTNGEDHRQNRRFIGQLMSPDAIAGAKARYEACLEDRINAMQAAQTFDAQADLATPLAISFMAGLMGLPKSDSAWLGRLIRSLSRAIDIFVPLDAYVEIERDLRELLEYLDDLLEQKKYSPDGSLLHRAAELIPKIDSKEQIALSHNLALVAIAGASTMNDTVGMVVEGLIEHRAQAAAVDIESSKAISRAAEELFRYYSPVEMVGRYAVEPIELESGLIPKAAIFCCIVASANRDESVFKDAAMLDLKRPKTPHLSFGFGPHTCLGSHAARYELTTLLPKLLPVVSRFDLVSIDPAWRRSCVFRGLEAVPLRVRAS